MKTRIISGIVMGAIVAAALALGIFVSDWFVTGFMAIIAAIGSYELLGNAAGIKSKAAIIGAFVYTAAAVAVKGGNVAVLDGNLPLFLGIAFFLYAVVIILKNHKDFGLAQIVTFCAMPIILAFAFSFLGFIINVDKKLYYLVLLFNFASICDMGAYFVGVTMGKHKLCPNISPKKTVEGAIGGIVSAMIFAVIFCLLFGHGDKLVPTVIVTIPLCIVGMLGDLFASSIKRSVNLKDYGNLIPGHGGVLDRVDSMLLIAPVLYALVVVGVI